MVDSEHAAWPRPYFKPSNLTTKLFFVCFAQSPLADLPLAPERFGVPRGELLRALELRDYERASAREFVEGWWSGSFGAIAERELAEDSSLLKNSDRCVTLRLELADQPDLAPLQTAWGVTRWLCERGARIVLDVPALRFRARHEVESLDFGGSDVQRDVKLVLEKSPTRDGLHLMHTRGLCKCARPELFCFIRPDDAEVVGRFMNQIARTFMEGVLPEQIRLRAADSVELVTKAVDERTLVNSLGIEAAVALGRSDGESLAGIGRLIEQ